MTMPSAAAVAKALETTQHDHTAVSWPDTGWGRCTPGHLCGLCTAVAFALDLDAFARERAAAVWEGRHGAFGETHSGRVKISHERLMPAQPRRGGREHEGNYSSSRGMVLHQHCSGRRFIYPRPVHE